MSLPLPSGLFVTPGPPVDFDEFAGFVAAVTEAQVGHAVVSPDWLRAAMATSGFDGGSDMVFVRDGPGALAGVAWVICRDPFVEVFCRGFVAHEWMGRGLGSHLLDWQLQRAGQLAAQAANGLQVDAKIDVEVVHEPSVALVTDHGFEVERYFLEMRIDFGGEPIVPRPLPGNLALAPFDPDHDVERLVAAIVDAFQDHYGHIDRPLEDEVARFRTWIDTTSFDPSLIWLVVDGDEIAGHNICMGNYAGDDTIGYVGNIGVRRPWRGQKIATALLEVAFAEFIDRGRLQAVLHVDAASTTGATRLYESVGMHESARSAFYSRELRAGRKISVS